MEEKKLTQEQIQKIMKLLPEWASIEDVEITHSYYGETAIVLTLKDTKQK